MVADHHVPRGPPPGEFLGAHERLHVPLLLGAVDDVVQREERAVGVPQNRIDVIAPLVHLAVVGEAFAAFGVRFVVLRRAQHRPEEAGVEGASLLRRAALDLDPAEHSVPALPGRLADLPEAFPLQLAAERHAGLPGVDLRHGGLHADRSAPPEAEQQRPALPVLVHGEVAVEAEQEPRLVCRLTDVRAADDIARDAPCRGIGLHAVHLLAREREQRLAPARVGEAEDGAALRGAHFGENAVRGPHPEVVGAADDRRGVHRRRGRFRRRCLRQRAEHDAAASYACRRASDVGESDGRPVVHALRQGDERRAAAVGKFGRVVRSLHRVHIRGQVLLLLRAERTRRQEGEQE